MFFHKALENRSSDIKIYTWTSRHFFIDQKIFGHFLDIFWTKSS